MNNKGKAFGIIVSGLCSFSSLGSVSEHKKDNPIAVVSMEIPYAYTESNTGVYNKVFEKLTEGYTGDITVSFVPSARLTRIMKHREVDCDYIGTNKIERWEKDGISPDELEFIGPIRELYVTAYVPAGSKVPKTVEELKPLRFAADVNLLSVVNKHGIHETFSLQSQVQMLNLLSIGRIEALIGYDFDLDTLAPRLGVEHKIVKTDIRMAKLVDGVICFKNEKTASFRKHVRTNLKKITESGWLDAEFERFFASQRKKKNSN